MSLAERAQNRSMNEALALGRLVLGHEPPTRAAQRYVEVQDHLPRLTTGQRALLDLVIAHPAFGPFIDGGLSLRAPSHPMRQRLLVMLAILETEPFLADTFLPRRPVPFELLRFLYRGCRAALLAVTGALLLRIVAHD